MTEQGSDTQAVSKAGQKVAIGIAIVAAVFSLAVGTYLGVIYAVEVSGGELDQQKQMAAMLNVLKEQPNNDTLKAEVRRLDEKLRENYHTRMQRYQTGAWLLVGGVIVFLLSGAVAAELGRQLPAPVGAPQTEAAVHGLSRTSIGFGLGILCVLGVWLVMEGKGVVSDYEFKQEIARLEQGKTPADNNVPAPKTGNNAEPTNGATPDGQTSDDDNGEKDPPKPAGPEYASFKEYADQWAQFRGWQGMAVCNFKDIPAEWDEESGKNIAWKVPVAMKGLSSPIVWGDKVFLTGATRQKRETYCYDAKTGKLLWTGTYQSNPDAPTDYSVYDDVSEVIHASPTPVADGKHVYSFFANGEVACFDFDGKFVWSRYVASPLDNGYGNSASLLKYKNTVIVLLDGEELGLYGLDGKTGKVLWSTRRNGYTWASPILIKSPKGSVQVVCASSPVVEAFDPNTGEHLWKSGEILGGDVAPTPTYNGGRVYAGMKEYSLAAFDPDQKGKLLWELWELEESDLPETTSPVSNGELVYYHEGYMLVCVDAKTGEIVYEQEVDEQASYASPTIVGDKLYLFAGNKALIVQVGREFKLLGTNKLDSSTWMDASPAFAPGRMYLRGGGHLYCITKKAQ